MAELEASVKLTQGALQMEESPIALELRRMRMLSEIGVENHTTTVVLLPFCIHGGRKAAWRETGL